MSPYYIGKEPPKGGKGGINILVVIKFNTYKRTKELNISITSKANKRNKVLKSDVYILLLQFPQSHRFWFSAILA